jgi:hypothetical protein
MGLLADATSRAGRHCLQEGDSEPPSLLFMYCMLNSQGTISLLELIFQVKKMKELRKGYSIVGLSQVCSCYYAILCS